MHQARVATRRLRELVPVLAADSPSGPAAKASRKLRRLTRALGTVRELDVMLHLLEELAGDQAVSRLAVEDVRARIVAQREERRPLMLERLESVSAAKLARRLASMSDALATCEEERWRGVLGARLVKRAARLEAAVGAAGQLFAPERLHEVRLAAKKFRYALELAAESGVDAAAPHARSIKRAQEVLGRLNDLHVLQQHVAAVQTTGPRRPGRREGFSALAARLEEESRHLHARYLGSVPAVLAACAAARADIVPRLEGRGRRPLKMGIAVPRARAGRGR